jgi:hypothetical protein
MTVSFTLKRKFIVNGKEYASADERPPNDREAYQQALQISGLTAPKEIFCANPGFSKLLQDQKPIAPESGTSCAPRILILSDGIIIMLYLIFFFLK